MVLPYFLFSFNFLVEFFCQKKVRNSIVLQNFKTHNLSFAFYISFSQALCLFILNFGMWLPFNIVFYLRVLYLWDVIAFWFCSWPSCSLSLRYIFMFTVSLWRDYPSILFLICVLYLWDTLQFCYLSLCSLSLGCNYPLILFLILRVLHIWDVITLWHYSRLSCSLSLGRNYPLTLLFIFVFFIFGT